MKFSYLSPERTGPYRHIAGCTDADAEKLADAYELTGLPFSNWKHMEYQEFVAAKSNPGLPKLVVRPALCWDNPTKSPLFQPYVYRQGASRP